MSKQHTILTHAIAPNVEAAVIENEVTIDLTGSHTSSGTPSMVTYPLDESNNDDRVVVNCQTKFPHDDSNTQTRAITVYLPDYTSNTAPDDGWQCEIVQGDIPFANVTDQSVVFTAIASDSTTVTIQNNGSATLTLAAGTRILFNSTGESAVTETAINCAAGATQTLTLDTTGTPTWANEINRTDLLAKTDKSLSLFLGSVFVNLIIALPPSAEASA